MIVLGGVKGNRFIGWGENGIVSTEENWIIYSNINVCTYVHLLIPGVTCSESHFPSEKMSQSSFLNK